MALTSNRQPKHFCIYEKVSEQAFRYTGFFSHSVLFLCVRVFGHQEEYFIMSLLRTINCTAYLPSLRCKHCVFIVCFLALAPICHVGMGMFLHFVPLLDSCTIHLDSKLCKAEFPTYNVSMPDPPCKLQVNEHNMNCVNK